ncbi:MAG: YfhO family protein, partial [Prevotellaceae bacterium]|nr:YfhO family protein [Prevotellaceae bacterium]
DKRYLNDNSFSDKKFEDSYQKTAADEYILQDTSQSYRVLNLSVDTYNETHTSYFHKSIGGYHAAKLRKYQELIDHRIGKEMNIIRSVLQSNPSFEAVQNMFLQTPTLNMLNAKYIIYDPNSPPLTNPHINGNAWFIDTVEFVPDADMEMAALHRIDPLTTAVVNEKFADKVRIKHSSADEKDFIRLIEYKPNMLTYKSESSSDRIAVFSEIYYEHGWKAFIDGKQTDCFRTDWILRAINVPAGKHEIVFRFEPDVYNSLTLIGSIVSLVFLLVFVGTLVYFILLYVKKTKAEQTNNPQQKLSVNTQTSKMNTGKKGKNRR